MASRLPFFAVALLATLGVTAGRLAGATPEVPVSKCFILSCRTSSPAEFEQLAGLVKEMGATDIDVSDLPKDRWQWFDPTDPYPNWSMLASGILKVMVPPELQPAVPTANALRSQKILAERGDILRRNGLQAFFHGCEPMWLPEAVYLEHPTWRGCTCQAPERSRHNYWAPCIDRPEVLDLYKKATADLCRLVPIEEFDLLANDSGSGICWDPGLYTGANGPEDVKDRPLADRVNGFMTALRDGAKEAGVDSSIVINKYHLLAPGHPEKIVSAGGSDYFWSSKVYPVVGIPDTVQFAAELENVFAQPNAEWRVGIPTLEFTSFFDLIRLFRQSPIHGPLQRTQALDTLAANVVGVPNAARLVQAWQDIHDAIQVLAQIDNGGPVLLLGTVNQRWLVRPLVPFPLELPPAEKDYYRRFQFQGNTEENAANLMNLQGLYAISGDAGTKLAHDLFQHTLGHLRAARRQLTTILAVQGAPASVQALDLRLQALIFVTKNADITARYQAYLDRFRPEWRLRPDHHGFPTAQDGKNLVAEDEANTRDLIRLLQSTDVPLIAVAPTVAEEDVFQFGPELISELENKIKIEDERISDHYRL